MRNSQDVAQVSQDLKQYRDLAENMARVLMCEESFMSMALWSLVQSHRLGQPLEVAGVGNPGYDVFLKFARMLDVEVRVGDIQSTKRSDVVRWILGRSSKCIRAWIPSIEYRFHDMHLIVQFLFEHHLRSIRERLPEFKMPQVDCTYLLFLWSECFSTMRKPVYALVLHDIVRSETLEVLTAGKDPTTGRSNSELMGDMLKRLSPHGRMYLGCWSYTDAKNAAVANTPIIADSKRRVEEFVAGASWVAAAVGGSVGWYVCDGGPTWHADEIGIILRNTISHTRSKCSDYADDSERAFLCLRSRIEGKSEAEIATLMGFDWRAQYDLWLEECDLGIDNSRYRNLYDRWCRACVELGIEPSDTVVQSLVGHAGQEGVALEEAGAGQQVVLHEADTDMEPLPRMILQMDGRSVLLPGGEYITLTSCQGEVISMLYDAAMLDMPELSSKFLVNEVYGDGTEKRLKKLFNNNTVFEKLIEKGSKRGMVRLKKSLCDPYSA